MTTEHLKQKANVLILHTGGTFGMAEATPVIPPPKSNEFLVSVLQRVPELAGIANLELGVVCNIDSSDMTPLIWEHIVQAIVKNWHKYDGFVVIHGTDTMAYTAAALSYILGNLTKPVVLTGSQRPLSELRSDARANLIDAVELATTHIPEVMICFDSQIHRGTRVTKASNEHLQAFRPLNLEPLGHFGVHLIIDNNIALKPFPKQMRVAPQIDTRFDANVSTLTAVPGLTMSENLVDAIVEQSHGIVIRAFGVGNLPLQKSLWNDLCQKALDKKIPVVLNSQCLSGRVSLSTYENGRVFRDLQVISAEDMSFEACVVKLMCMLGRGVHFENRFDFFYSPLARECSDAVVSGEASLL